MKRFIIAAVGLALALGIVACRQGDGLQTNNARDLSIDPEFVSDYCLGRYCPSPIAQLSLAGEYRWTVKMPMHEGSKEAVGAVRSRYDVLLEPERQPVFASVPQPYDAAAYYVGFLDEYPLDAFSLLANTVTIFDSESSARSGFSVDATGSPLPGKWGQLLEPVGYDEALLHTSSDGVSLLVRRGRVVIHLGGDYVTTSEFAAGVRDAATAGIVRAMALLLARADDPAETMIVTGKILLNGRPSTDSGVYLTAFTGSWRVALNSFDPSLSYTIAIEGTAGMKGEAITFELTARPSCAGIGVKCVASETILFEPGKTREVDLHFESNG